MYQPLSVCVAAAASLAAGQERQGRKRSKVAGGGHDWRIVAIERGERRPPCMAVSVDIFVLPSSRGSIHSFSTRFSFMRAFGYDLLGMHANKSSRSFTLLTPSPCHTRQTGHSNTLFSSSNVDLLGMESCSETRTTSVRGTWTLISLYSGPLIIWTSVINDKKRLSYPIAYWFNIFPLVLYGAGLKSVHREGSMILY